jgi:hypothetical protein
LREAYIYIHAERASPGIVKLTTTEWLNAGHKPTNAVLPEALDETFIICSYS